jgi:acyl-CoA synthetase (AMP-forming)/AMP-acid ligase II
MTYRQFNEAVDRFAAGLQAPGVKQGERVALMLHNCPQFIIAGGYNIYPADVEAELYKHPEIKEAAVIGVPDERRGKSVKAFTLSKTYQWGVSEAVN